MKKSIGTKTFLHEHIRYEIDMLFYSYLKLIDYLKIKDQLNINAFLEVFSFHARNLYDFFYRDNKKYSTDSRAYDFFNEKSDWLNILPEPSKSKQQVDKRIGKEIAHLTYKRINGTTPNKGWNSKLIFQDLIKLIKLFLEKLPEEFDGNSLLNKYKL